MHRMVERLHRCISKILLILRVRVKLTKVKDLHFSVYHNRDSRKKLLSLPLEIFPHNFLNYVLLMAIRIIVYANEDAKRNNKRLFERLLHCNDDVVFPYYMVQSALNVLFDGCIIVFESVVLKDSKL